MLEFGEDIAWFILLAPLVASLLITLFTRKDGPLSAYLSIGAVLVSLVITLLVFDMMRQAGFAGKDTERVITWLSAGDFKINLALRLDVLSLLMALVVTGVGGAIHIYSYGYMKEDPSMGRFFAGLSLFTFSMLGIVFATNLVMMFIFWELVGVSSYLLIGFWYEKGSAGDAAKKAFITNRLGDFGFLLGILLIWGVVGSIDFEPISTALKSKPGSLGNLAGVAGLLIFCGAMGKSAQFPLHVWLPDAMEGPTPVSALIHAATMVAAGVYMLCRLYFLYTIPVAWPECLAFLHGVTPLQIIAWIGGITALLAALMAVQQNDIKRILAYSTLSQLGYMVMAVGLTSPGVAMFHLTTHAFFKALLFLGAGAVIYALHHEQDIWKMGALKGRIPVTWLTFLVATLALCGVPPLSGFYSKDAILAAAHHSSTPLFVLAVGVVGLTSFYMFRLLFVVFLGPQKDARVAQAHEPPKVMTLPLVFLALLTIGGGFMGITAFLGQMPALKAAGHAASFVAVLLEPFRHDFVAAMLGLGATALGLVSAWVLYRTAQTDPLPGMLGPVARLLRDKFYLDEIYQGVIGLTHEAMAKVAAWVDVWIISGLGVRGTHGATELAGRALRLFQTGNLQTYAFLFVAGVAVVLWRMLR